jgi:single-strand DNA-binding protein
MVGSSAVWRIITLLVKVGSRAGVVRSTLPRYHSKESQEKDSKRDMVSFNRVVLAGNLTRDPELRFTQEGVPVCSFSIAVNRVRSKSEAVDFFNVSCWRELGERVANYKKKGDPILVEGRLKYRTWQAPDGAKRSAVEVVADRVQFLSRAQNPQPEKNPQAAEVAAGASAKVGARKTAAAAARGVGGWGHAAKQLHDGRDDTDFGEEDFEDIPF